ncbi:MAG: N-acetylneuraminate synthase [Bacteroidetes bacterium]|nr:N-acetylneuraminate synthase [Bacteroidota bacterium]
MMLKRTLIIAEAGVNHNGNMGMAKQLIDAAAEAGADYVKFQTFKTEKLVSAVAKQAEYQQKNMNGSASGSQFDMLKKLELSVEQHHELIAYCKQKNIRFLSTAFDLESIDLLVSLGIELFKVPSGEITNLPYLRKIGALKKQVIVSTGMCVMSEIEAALNELIKSGTDKKNISVLHCTTDYPTAMQDVNLLAMLEIKEQLNVEVGYSDHTLGIEVPVAAVAMGAAIIEKHFTLDKSLPGPDHKASLDPAELKAMATAIRNIENALGKKEKQPSEAEKKNMLVARKSIHLSKALPKGHVLSESDLIMKRPGDGISPMEMEQVIGKKLKHDSGNEHKLKGEDLE